MLSYQHAFHAGNFADVLKHAVLTHCFLYLKKKTNPLCYIDTHAGAGKYSLNTAQAQKNKEYQSGIGTLWQTDNIPPLLGDYLNVVRHFNPSSRLSYYPGSPLIARELLDETDRKFFFELHTHESRSLAELCQKDRRCKVFRADGLTECLGLLPPTEHRGLVLIDPSYELKTDYQAVTDALKAMHKRFATGCYLLWYPVVERKRNRFLERNIIASGIKNIQLYELGIQPDTDDFGMTACGIIAVNPPFTLWHGMQETLPWLSETLAVGQSHHRIEQLVGE